MRRNVCFTATVISLAMTFYCCGAVEIEWVYIDDPGISGHEGFTGYVSKYETTNAQYCQFLNDALASGDITVGADNIVYGAFGSNDGLDFVNKTYYDLTGPGMTYDGATNGGAARINYNGSLFNVDAGFEDHPVTYVSWYGSRAFCYYYGFRLPTDSEWQAVADYDGTYIYGCGPSIDNNVANYFGSIHPDGTTVVGSFGSFGYGLCDMTGNVWEWADNPVHDGVIKGGAWASPASFCEVSVYHTPNPLDFMHDSIGFRAVNPITDSDGDGVPDDEDPFPNSDTSPTIIINGEDTGITNVLLEDGSTLSDLIGQVVEADHENQDIVGLLVWFKEEGWIDGSEMGRLLRILLSK